MSPAAPLYPPTYICIGDWRKNKGWSKRRENGVREIERREKRRLEEDKEEKERWKRRNGEMRD